MNFRLLQKQKMMLKLNYFDLNQEKAGNAELRLPYHPLCLGF